MSNSLTTMTSNAAADVGLYVHIPFCVRKCPYCAFYSVPLTDDSPRRLFDAILAEGNILAPAEPVETLYLGGGSPSCVPVDLLCGWIDAITSRIGIPQEITVECNPAQTSPEWFTALRRCGVNRVSIGAQSFNAEELRTLGRPHTPEAIDGAVSHARAAGLDNIAIDLIFGIPGSTVETFARSLARAVALEPTHLSAYSLTWEDGTPMTTALAAGRIQPVDEEAERRMYTRLCEVACAAGYRQYEISNFARPGFQCRHNLRYWHNLPVIGLGPSAGGWYRNRRTTNIADVNGYIQRIANGQPAWDHIEQPAPLQIASETAILNLRLTEGIDTKRFARQTGYDATALFAEAIARHHAAGLLEQTATHLRLTEAGRSFADTVACDLIGP